MANGASNRIPSNILAADRMTLITLQTLADYSPRNLAFGTPTLVQQAAALTSAEEAEIAAWRAYEVAREQAIAAGLVFHDSMQGAKTEVVAQYGADSPAVHAIGRKQKSERRRPTRRTSPSA